MATGDKLRDINPQDCFVTNAAGAIIGIQAGADASTAARLLNEAQVAALAPVVLDTSGTGAATANTTAINAALLAQATGRVFVSGIGSAYINGTLTIYRKTTLEIAKGLRLVLAPASNVNMLRNASWGSTQNAITTLSTPDLGITVSAASAALPAVDSYVIILGASPRVYNGPYRVLTSGAGIFTAAMSTRLAPVETPSTPATGTITWMQADDGITVIGSFDYNGANQTTPDTWQKHCIYMRRIVGVRTDVEIRNATKYALSLANIYDSEIPRSWFETNSDGLHIHGSWDNVKVGCVQGKTGDDMVAAGQSEYPQYIDSAYVSGDAGSLRVDSIQANGSLTAFKYFGYAGAPAKSISLGAVQGRISGGSGFVSIITDTGCTNAASGSIEDFSMEYFHPAEAVSTACINISGPITINSIKVGKFDGVLNDNANARVLNIGSGSVVSNMQVGDMRVAAAIYSGNASGIYVSGTLSQLHVNNLHATNIVRPLFLAGSAGTSNIQIDNLITVNCGQAFRTVAAAGCTLQIGYLERNGYQSSPHIDFSHTASGITFSCSTGKGLFATDAFGGSGNNKVIQYAPCVGIDVGGTGVLRTAGALVYHKSGTARGSLVSDNLVVCDATAAANSWKQISNTTNVY